MCAGPNGIICGSHLNSTWVPPKECVGPTWASHEQYMGPTWGHVSHGVAPNLVALVYVYIKPDEESNPLGDDALSS